MTKNNKTKEELVRELKRLRKQLSVYENPGNEIANLKNELEALQNNLDQLLNVCTDMFFTVDKENTFLSAGGQRLKKYNLAPKNIIGKSVSDFLSEDEAQLYLRKHCQVFESGESLTYEHTYEFNGVRSTDVTTIYPVRNKEGNIINLGVLCRDITKRKKAEEALRESERKFRAAVENSPDFIVFIHRDGTIFDLNRVEKGFTREMVVGHSVFDEKWYESTDQLISVRNAIDNSIKNKKTTTYEYSQSAPNGSHSFYETIVTPFSCYDKGDIISLQLVTRDITARMELEQKIKDTIKLLENVYSSLDEAVLVVQPITRIIISCNNAAERMFGYSKKEMIGRNTEFLHVNKKMYKEFGKTLVPTLETEGIFRKEFKLRKKNGTVFPTDHTVKIIKDDTGHRIMDISVVRDITYQKNTMKELKDKEETLKAKNIRLGELNTALKVLLEQRDQEKKILEENFSESINSMIIPYLDRIRKTDPSSLQEEYINVLESNLREIIKPYMHRISGKMMQLSPSETRIVSYVKQGYNNKEIASILNISLRTVESHRDNIRKKLGIKNRKINLKTYLSNIKY